MLYEFRFRDKLGFLAYFRVGL